MNLRKIDQFAARLVRNERRRTARLRNKVRDMLTTKRNPTAIGFYLACTCNAPFEEQLMYWDGERAVCAYTGAEITNALNFRGPLTGPLFSKEAVCLAIN